MTVHPSHLMQTGARFPLRRVAAAMLGSMICGCVMAHGPLGVIKNLRIEGYEASSSFCASFRPRRRAVAAFLEKAVVVSGQALHDDYDVYPCSAHGTLTVGHATWSWTLRAGGTALLTSKGKPGLVLADPSQQTSLSEQ